MAITGLTVTTFIWGATFVLVKDALLNIPPFAFSGWRFMIASLLSIAVFYRHWGKYSKTEIFGGIITGFFLFSGYGFQNFGLMLTSASKSAFITSISIIMVPVILVLIRAQNIQPKIWLSMVMALTGLFLVLNPQVYGLNRGDILTMGCALSFALHIIAQDRFTNRQVNTFRFFIVQGFTVSLLSFGNHFIFEPQTINWSTQLILALSVTAVFATLFGFTVMIAAQKILNPSRTAIILSLEPLFATLVAILFAGEQMSPPGWIGGILIIAGVIIAEIE